MLPDLKDRASPRYLDGMFGRWPNSQPSGFAELALKTAPTAAVTAWTRAFKTHKRLASDVRLTEASRILKSAENARERWDQARAKADEARAQLAERRGQIAERFAAVTKPPTDAGKAAMHAEVRAFLRDLDGEARARMVAGARDKADLEMLAAISTAPAFLSGIGAELHASATDVLRMIHATEEWTEAQTLDDAEAKLDHAMRALDEHMATMPFAQAAAITATLAEEEADEAA